MSIYETRILPQKEMIRSHLGSGGTLAALARKLGIASSSLYRCIRKHPELKQTLRNAACEKRDEADNAVENALFQRAVGFEQPDGKFVPPDVRAAVFWLKNRRPARWKDRLAPEDDTAGIGFDEDDELL